MNYIWCVLSNNVIYIILPISICYSKFRYDVCQKVILPTPNKFHKTNEWSVKSIPSLTENKFMMVLDMVMFMTLHI